MTLMAYNFKFIVSLYQDRSSEFAGVDINARAAKAKSIDRPPMRFACELNREAARASPRSIITVSSLSVKDWEILDNLDIYFFQALMYSQILSTVVDESGSSP